jgi:hypothetical protein
VDGGDRLDLISLRIPDPLPIDYIVARGLSVDKVRQKEREHAQAIQAINTIVGYVSPSALYKRQDIMAGLLAYDKKVQQSVSPMVHSAQDRVEAWKQAAVRTFTWPVELPAQAWKNQLEAIVGPWTSV